MYSATKQILETELDGIRDAGLYKSERVIESPQDAHIDVAGGEVLNMCANNSLGLADHPDVIEAAKKALDDWGFGLASVRFICGTQEIHKKLEAKISEFLGTEDTILYAACFDANGGVFDTHGGLAYTGSQVELSNTGRKTIQRQTSDGQGRTADR